MNDEPVRSAPLRPSRGWRFGDFEVDVGRRQLSHRGQAVRVEPRVLELLVHLLSHADQLVSKEQLLREVWGTPHVTDWAISRAVADLRRVLREHGGQAKWIGTVHGRGYRWQAPLEALVADASGGETRATSATAPGSSRRIGLLGLALLLVVFGWWLRPRPAPPLREALPHVVVVPPEAVAPIAHWLGTGLADDVITRLAHHPELRVLSRGSGERVGVTGPDRAAAAASLGADHLLELSLRPMENGLLANARLTRAADAVVVWSEQYQSTEPRISEIAEQIGRDVVTTLLSQPPAPRAKPGNTDAEVAFLRGRHLMQRRGSDDLIAAQKFFAESIAHDPDYAPAWAGKAAAHMIARIYYLESAEVAWPQAAKAAERALLLDPELADTHAVLGLIAVNQDWDFSAARQHYARALQLAPSHLSALQWSAELAMFEGRDQDAERWISQAMALDPTSPVLIGISGLIEAARGRRQQARARFEEALRLEPQFFWLYREMAYLDEWDNRPAEALATRVKEMQLRGISSAAMAALLAATAEEGPTGFYRWYLNHLQSEYPSEEVAQELIAEALAVLGRHDQAVAVLRRHGRQMGEALPHHLVRSPALRDPRYRQVATELGLHGLRAPVD